MRKLFWWGVIAYITITFDACKKDSDTGVLYSNVKINVAYTIDGNKLHFDSVEYFNAAGNHYSVERLQYYISNITFYRTNGNSLSKNTAYYIDAKRNETSTLEFYEIPQNTYNKISFNIGLDTLHNKTDSLPFTVDNMNMAWPIQMGGGYHFMKLEGHYISGVNKPGYAMHLGRNENLVTVTINKNLIIDKTTEEFQLTMNVNEWFKNPMNYDFEVDGNYSMSNMNAMMKLSNNGADVYTLEKK